MSNYLIRVQLPDRPDALGAVASRIGSVGGDVISIDILEREHGVVVDELGVGLPGDDLVGLLRDEVLEVDGVSSSRCARSTAPCPTGTPSCWAWPPSCSSRCPRPACWSIWPSGSGAAWRATFAVVYDCAAAEW